MSETYKVLNQAKNEYGVSQEPSYVSEATIAKWGNSQGIRIPRALMEQLNLNLNDKVEISVADNTMYIKKSRQYQNLKERMEAFYNEPIENIFVKSTDDDWGNPMGNEIW